MRVIGVRISCKVPFFGNNEDHVPTFWPVVYVQRRPSTKSLGRSVLQRNPAFDVTPASLITGWGSEFRDMGSGVWVWGLGQELLEDSWVRVQNALESGVEVSRMPLCPQC